MLAVARARWTRRHAAAGAAVLVTALAAPAGALAAPAVFGEGACVGAQCTGAETYPGPSLKIKALDTPALTLEQVAGTYPAQSWDVGGNDENFFVRDQAGPTLPLRIRPRAPTSSIDIAANGNVGIDGTGDVNPALPTAALQVTRTNGTAKLRVQESSPTVAPRVLGELSNDGPAQLEFQDASANGTPWRAGGSSGGTFVLTSPGQATDALTVRPTGDLLVSGTLQQSVDPAQLTGGRSADTASILRAVTSIPISTYKYGEDPTQATHIGPAAAAFRSAFGLGSSDSTIAPGDLAAVSLAAVQQLAKTPPGSDPRMAKTVTGLSKTTKRVSTLESANKKLTKRVSTLEKQVKALLKRRK